MPPPCAVLLIINRKKTYLRHGTDPSLRLEEVHRPGGSKVLPWLTQPAPTVGTVGENHGKPMVFSGKIMENLYGSLRKNED